MVSPPSLLRTALIRTEGGGYALRVLALFNNYELSFESSV
jgi:hypothetical protein